MSFRGNSKLEFLTGCLLASSGHRVDCKQKGSIGELLSRKRSAHCPEYVSLESLSQSSSADGL